MKPCTIGSINLLEVSEKVSIYSRVIPQELLDRFSIPESFNDQQGRPLLTFKFAPGKSDVEMKLYHQIGFPDPILYGHLTDTISGQIHILLYVLNDPDAERFDVDRMPDGSRTGFGIIKRNIEAETAAMKAGLAPGQIRSGLRLLPAAIKRFEEFIESLGHKVFFAEPLYYHVAVLFERYGFAYQKGRQKMERIEKGFHKNGELFAKMNDSTVFRSSTGVNSIRMRSWAIHDLVLGEPFTEVTMYKNVGKSAGVVTCPDCDW